MGTAFGITIVLFGILFLGWPEAVIGFIALVIGVSVSISGIYLAVSSRYRYEQLPYARAKMVIGVLLFVLGIFISINTNLTVTVAGLFVGFFAFLSAGERIYTGIARRRLRLKYGATIIFGIVHGLFGILMVYAAMQAFSLIVMFAGVYLLIAGGLMIISTSYLRDF
jgi:uncharacterized membrane protein HdeD (DUF308 family)